MEGLFDWVSLHGSAAIFVLLMLGIVGLPVPDETLLVFCGYLISSGRLRPLAAFFSALAGSWCGISLSYLIGRTFGLGVVHRFGRFLHITDARLAKVHFWFHRAGHWALFVGYYIAGVRHLTAIVAGTSRLEFPSFIAYAWSGGLVWVSTFLTLGYFLGENWRQIAELIHRYVSYASVLVIVLALCVYLFRRKKKSAPSAAGGDP
jgi:membrane protein DedA with SNARE-associated domain